LARHPNHIFPLCAAVLAAPFIYPYFSYASCFFFFADDDGVLAADCPFSQQGFQIGQRFADGNFTWWQN